jgi:hypothetical protein
MHPIKFFLKLKFNPHVKDRYPLSIDCTKWEVINLLFQVLCAAGGTEIGSNRNQTYRAPMFLEDTRIEGFKQSENFSYLELHNKFNPKTNGTQQQS